MKGFKLDNRWTNSIMFAVVIAIVVIMGRAVSDYIPFPIDVCVNDCTTFNLGLSDCLRFTNMKTLREGYQCCYVVNVNTKNPELMNVTREFCDNHPNATKGIYTLRGNGLVDCSVPAPETCINSTYFQSWCYPKEDPR